MARTQTFLNGEVGLNIRNKLNSLAEWTGSYSYNTYDVTHFSGSIYASLVDSNLGNNPSTSAQWRNLTLTASLATSASYVPNLYPQTVQVSASWASASLTAVTTSYALVAEVALNVSVPVSVSYASASLTSDTASFVANLYPQIEQISASWASASLSSQTSSYALVAEVVLNASTMVSVSYSSASLNADTASYVPDLYPQTVQVSASWASASLSSSYSLYAGSAPTVGLTDTRSFTESGSAQTNTVHILNGLIIDWFQV